MCRSCHPSAATAKRKREWGTEQEITRAQGEEGAAHRCVCFWGGSVQLNEVPEGTKLKFLVQEDCEPGQCSVGFPVPINRARLRLSLSCLPGKAYSFPRWLMPHPIFLRAPQEYLLLLFSYKITE